VTVASVIEHLLRMRRIILLSLAYHVFSIISSSAQFSMDVNEHEIFLLIFTKNLSKSVQIQKELTETQPKMYTGLHVKYPLLLPNFIRN
jgi:hypothetical protein